MEMHAIQSKQASMSSGCIVGKPYLGITSSLPVIRPVTPTALILLPEPDTQLSG